MAYIYDLSDQWTAAGTTFTGIKLSVTDTASAAGSLLMDLQVSGVSKVSVRKDGRISGDGANPYVSLSQVGGTELGWSTTRVFVGNSTISLISTGTVVAGVNSSGQFSLQNSYLGFGTSINSPDVFLFRDAANTLAQRNGVNAQAFNLYNTYTDASNYERGFMRFVSNTLRIGTEKLGTGLARGLALQTDGTTRLSIASNGTAEFTIAGGIYINGQVGIAPVSTGVMRLVNYNADGFSILQLGPNTTGFPALKVSTSTLQVRLGNDSAFTNIQGKLTTEANAVSETITATHTITLYDAAGTAYKVPCVAV